MKALLKSKTSNMGFNLALTAKEISFFKLLLLIYAIVCWVEKKKTQKPECKDIFIVFNFLLTKMKIKVTLHINLSSTNFIKIKSFNQSKTADFIITSWLSRFQQNRKRLHLVIFVLA